MLSNFTKSFFGNRILNAFTLAEVLIVIGLIGIVANMVMPRLLVDVQKQVVVTQLQKAYSTINSAIRSAEGDSGPCSNWDWTTTSISGSDIRTGTDFWQVESYGVPVEPLSYISQHLKVMKSTHGGAKMYMLDGSVIIFARGAYEQHYIQNGVPETELILQQGDYAIEFDIDINSDKGPNRNGRDRFKFYLKKDGTIRPVGDRVPRATLLTNDGANFRCAAGSPGEACAALIMLDSWQISDDYPWGNL